MVIYMQQVDLYVLMTQDEFDAAKDESKVYDKDEYYTLGQMVSFNDRWYLKVNCSYETNYLLGRGWKEVKIEN